MGALLLLYRLKVFLAPHLESTVCLHIREEWCGIAQYYCGPEDTLYTQSLDDRLFFEVRVRKPSNLESTASSLLSTSYTSDLIFCLRKIYIILNLFQNEIYFKHHTEIAHSC